MTLLLISGNVSPNPGPVKDPCSVCTKPVAANHKALLCDKCTKWCHNGPKCGKVKVKDYKEYVEKESFEWICPICSEEINQEKEDGVFSNIKNILYQQPGLKIGHLNVDGLRGKLPEIKLVLQETGLDILAIRETKLAANVTENEIGMDGYFVVRKDRDRNGGGVLIYCKDSLTAYEEVKLQVPEKIEGIWINVKSQSQTWLVACIYRPPDKNYFHNLLNETLEKIWSSRKNILILGDLNSDMLFNGKTTEEKYLGKRLRNILSTYSLKNVIREPTRICQNAQTIIDLIITSHPENINTTGVSHLGISDHSLVYANLRMRKDKKKLMTAMINNYKNFNTSQFKRAIECAPWSVCEIFTGTEDQVWAWQHLYQNVKQQHISTRKVRNRE